MPSRIGDTVTPIAPEPLLLKPKTSCLARLERRLVDAATAFGFVSTTIKQSIANEPIGPCNAAMTKPEDVYYLRRRFGFGEGSGWILWSLDWKPTPKQAAVSLYKSWFQPEL
jgi:hypothetical protein